MTTTRQRRVGELVKEEIGLILQQEISDPRVGFVTVTDVEITADLREARVYVSVLGPPESQSQSLAVLQRAAGYIRSLLARRVVLRCIPELTFALDRSLERGSRVLEILSQLDESKTEGGQT